VTEPNETPLWDEAALEKRVRGKRERMVKLIQLFLDDMPERVQTLQTQVEQARLEEIREIAHTIKGVSANLGVMRLEATAGGIEAAARNSESAQTRTLLPQLVLEFEQSEQILRRFVAEGQVNG